MLKRWFKKEDSNMQEKVEVSSEIPKKSSLKSADIVFGVGILLIIGGIAYMVRQTFIPEASNVQKQVVVQDNSSIDKPLVTSSSSTPPPPIVDAQKLSTPPPYSEYTKHNKPWEREQRAKNIRAKVEQNIVKKEQYSVEQVQNISVAPVAKVVDIPIIPVLDKSSESEAFICTVHEKYKKFENREMLYYRAIITKGYTEYVPAFDQQKWNEKGINLKHRFMVSRIDVPSSMVEITPNKWIPALSFAKCVMVEDK